MDAPTPTDVGAWGAYFETAAERWYNRTVRELRMGIGKYALCYSVIRKGYFAKTRFQLMRWVF